MADLFSRTEVNFGGAMHAQNGIVGIVSLPGGGTVSLGILMQNMQIQYSQQVTRLYELGVQGAITNIYYVSGRAQGQMTAAHVIGPGSILVPFYQAFSDVCNAGSNNLVINVAPNVCGNKLTAAPAPVPAVPPTFVGPPAPPAPLFSPTTWTMKYCVLTQVGMTVAAQDFVINSSSQIMFSGMTVA